MRVFEYEPSLHLLQVAINELPEGIVPISVNIFGSASPTISLELDDFFELMAGKPVIYEKGHFRAVIGGVEYGAGTYSAQGPWKFILPAGGPGVRLADVGNVDDLPLPSSVHSH